MTGRIELKLTIDERMMLNYGIQDILRGVELYDTGTVVSDFRSRHYPDELGRWLLVSEATGTPPDKGTA